MKKINSIQSKVIKNIFNYEDYRALLEDYFNEQKEVKKQFSHRFFAQKAGIASSGYCAKVIKGVIKVSKDYSLKLCKGMDLNEDEEQYFSLLVSYCQANDIDSKMTIKRRLDSIRERSEAKSLTSKDVDFYKSWYIPVLRELVHYSDWNGDFSKLASLVYPTITQKEAIDGVQLLEEMGMITKNEEGRYSKNANIVKSGTVPPFARKKARRDIMQRAFESVELLSVDKRHVSYSTLAISEETYSKVEKYLDEVRENILDMALEDNRVEKIYHILLELFPSSHKIGDVNEIL